MLKDTKRTKLFYKYYYRWIKAYKEGAIRKVTMDKYLLASAWLEKLIPKMKICEMNRVVYQQLLMIMPNTMKNKHLGFLSSFKRCYNGCCR